MYDEISAILDESLVYATAKHVPAVNKKEFLQNCQKGDIILAYSRTDVSKLVKFRSKFLSKFQRSPYSSSKMVMDDNYVIGYGVKKRKAGGAVTRRLIRGFLATQSRCLLIRVPATDEQKDKAVRYLEKSILSRKYATMELYKAWWNRIFKEKFLQFKMPTNDLSDDDVLDMTRPLVCSSIIVYAYKAAGYNFNIRRKPHDIWPVDFLLDNSLEKICRLDNL